VAKNIYICSRKKLPDSIEKRLHEICKKLAPDNITPAEPRVLVNGDIAYGVMNPTSTLSESGTSLLMGQIFDKDEKWCVPLEEFPDGSYALFRDGKEHCEIVSDPVASRTIWYYMDGNIFIASTSQRMIVMFLGSFEFDERVIPWMLSTGTLGPAFSWDKRIKLVPADSSVILNKNKWSVTTKSNPIEFNLVKRSDERHEKLLRELLQTVFKTLNLDYSKWVLPLSGGYDSRGILCLLLDASPNSHCLRTITWGLKSSLDVKGNDAFIARELASKLNVPNKYYINDLSEEPIDRIINRFVLIGEGLIDNVSDYLDGFSMWKTIFENGIEGIIRGDEGFGCKPYSSPLAVRINQSCSLCSDFSNLKDYMKYGFPSQELPQHLNQRKGETLSAWRDRLFHEHTLPTGFSPLSDLKLSYVEQINPLLSRAILKQVRQLPDHLRTGKTLFKKIVISLSPEIDYATHESSASLSEILKQEQIVNLVKNELSSNVAKTLFPAAFLDFVLKGIKSKGQIKTVKTNSFSLRSFIGMIIPRFLKETLRNKVVLPSLDNNILAFRVFLICKMNKILNDDFRNN
jgi:hypothetical protein